MTPTEGQQEKKLTPQQVHDQAMAEFLSRQRENNANEAANIFAQMAYKEAQFKDELEMKDHEIKALQSQLKELQGEDSEE